LIGLIVMLLVGTGAAFAGWWLVAGRYTRVPAVTGESRATAMSALHKAGFDKVTVSQVNDDNVPTGAAAGTKPGANSRVRRHAPVTLLMSLGPKLYTLPNVQGKSQDSATKALGELPVQVATRQQSDDNVPKGTVIGTDPQAGAQVKRGQQVTVLVSSGPPVLTVPDVTGDKQDDATNTLQNMGFEVNVVEQFSDDDQGTVISQDPQGNSQLAKGRTVTLTVSQGSETITIPDIPAGTSVSDARKTLQNAGLKVKVRHVLGGGGDGGQVVSIDPPSGADAHRGDTVTLYAI
jgi:serine/threonine-protein kinase